MDDIVYLDNNATTRPCDAAVAAMTPFLTELYGNPSSVHRFGQRARQAIDEARGHIAALVGCAESELLLTCGGTESISTAIRGILSARAPRKRIITSTVEHSATRELCQSLAKDGYEVVELPVDSLGMLDPAHLASALTPDGAPDTAADTALVTLLYANNETGVIWPVETFAQLCRAAKVPLHLDGTQAVGKIPVNLAALGADAMSLASHKFHGPKGAGGLFLRKGIRVKPLLVGGPQERGRRGGTENVPAIVGMGAAAREALAQLPHTHLIARLRDELESFILHNIPHTSINGHPTLRLPNTTNISFAQLQADAILLLLSEKNLCASAGAACSSGSLEPSHVLRAMNIPPAIAHGAIRFSLSRYTTPQDIHRATAALPPLISRLRQVLPLA